MIDDQDHALVVIGHLADVRHVRRTDDHRGPLDDDAFCMTCWREATGQFLDELSEIRNHGSLLTGQVTP